MTRIERRRVVYFVIQQKERVREQGDSEKRVKPDPTDLSLILLVSLSLHLLLFNWLVTSDDQGKRRRETQQQQKGEPEAIESEEVDEISKSNSLLTTA